ncbi:hypothetical protein RIF29_29410 [Crotalaria pallida]|uniref:Uncharacterized protein n=1 Tax=Crotalaria pallida TaxID=3830 RepID=A0AAN9EET0_CROPI
MNREDDQKNRSNKKIKPNEEKAGNEIEMVDHHDQDACPEAMVSKPDFAMQVASPPPENSAQTVDENSAGILVSSNPEKGGKKIPHELTSRSSVGGEYGP